MDRKPMPQAEPSSNVQGRPCSPPRPQAIQQQKQQISPAQDLPPEYGNQAGTYPVRVANYPEIEPYPPPQSRLLAPAFSGSPYPTVIVYEEPAWLRFLKAFGVAVCIYLLFSMFIESLFMVAKWTHDHSRGKHDIPGGYSVPPGVSVQQCATNWKRVSSSSSILNLDLLHLPKDTFPDPSAFPFAVETSFEVPLNSSSLLVLARGPMFAGDLNLVTSSRQKVDMAHVSVTVRYFQKEPLESVKACYVSRDGGGQGVGVFTPDGLAAASGLKDWSRHLYFETTVVLPEAHAASPFAIKKFESDVPNTSQSILAEADKIQFDDFHLRGSNAPITVAALLAKKGTLQTTNGVITGSFDVQDHLKLETSNAAVRVKVGLKYTETLKVGPTLDITTSNGHIQADVIFDDLASNETAIFEGPRHPHYKVDTRTTNGRLDVSFLDPFNRPNIALAFNGMTTNGAASARLHRTYSGEYQASTTNGSADLRVFCEEVGAEGECKERRVRREVVMKDRISGAIEWIGGDGGEVKGSSRVELKTTNAPAVVIV